MCERARMYSPAESGAVERLEGLYRFHCNLCHCIADDQRPKLCASQASRISHLARMANRTCAFESCLETPPPPLFNFPFPLLIALQAAKRCTVARACACVMIAIETTNAYRRLLFHASLQSFADAACQSNQ